jgi:hypothetical protein
MSLPLAVRKDIRDNQAKIDDAKAKLAAALSFPDLTLEVNNESVHALLVEANHSKKDSFTEVVARYLDGLAKQLDLISKDAQVKAELHRVISAKKVAFNLLKTEWPSNEVEKYGRIYVGVSFHDGILELLVPVKNFWSNIDYISNPKEVDITKVLTLQTRPAGTLPLPVRVTITATEPKMAAAVKKISAAVGFECTLDWDPTASFLALEKEVDVSRIPFAEACSRYLDGLGDNLTGACKDDMVKEALMDKFKTKKAGVAVIATADFEKEKAKTGGDSYVGISFTGGNIVVVIPAKSFWSNIDNIKKISIEKLL